MFEQAGKDYDRFDGIKHHKNPPLFPPDYDGQVSYGFAARLDDTQGSKLLPILSAATNFLHQSYSNIG